MSECRWNGTERVTHEHQRGCDEPGCEGCKPCTEAHCTMPRCSRHLGTNEQLVCHRCVGKVRDNLGRIRELCDLAPIAATEAGIDSEAAVLAGPVPEHSTAAARHRWAMGGGLCRCHLRGRACPDHETLQGPACARTECGHVTCERIHGRRCCPDLVAWLEDTADQRHPLTVLGWWDIAVAELFGHHRTNRVTIDSAASYLAVNLTDLSRDRDFGFDEMAREIASCVDHVENVMAVAVRQQRGAPCPVCHAAGRNARRLVREYAEDQPDDTLDVWACPSTACGETWTIGQYDKYVQREHRRHATALTASALAAEYRVSEGSVRGWASKGQVRKRGKDTAGLTLYDVADTMAMREGSTPEVA